MVNSEQSHNPLFGKRAVICEDEGLIAGQVRSALKRAGVEVVGMAKNGQEAVEVVLAQRPDFVLMDVKMPMKDGLQAMAEIKQSFDTCFVMLTAFAGAPMVERALELGAYGYIVKPVDATRIISAVASAVNLCDTRHMKMSAA